VVRNVVRALWAEPRATDPPYRVWRDWALLAGLVPTAILEGFFRDELTWRGFEVVLGIVMAVALLWRRTSPLAVVLVVFGSLILVDLAGIVLDTGPLGLYTMIYVLALPYSLTRWGSGREAGVGLSVIMLTAVLSISVDYSGAVDAVVATVFLLFPATLGAAVRYWGSTRVRELDQIKLREREQLARELHDTVAHHVSAITIRAQAGRLLAVSDPKSAVAALEVIEQEALRTLAELRVMVGGLRRDEAPALTPQLGVADLGELTGAVGDRPRVELELSGDLDNLNAAVGAAVYRIAQESVTNAVRHARHATRIEVRVAGAADQVHLNVCDDGDPGATAAGTPGYGLVGMTERAALLGGTLEAGPRPGGGWTVQAVLPREGRVR
jgi:signal transduction histidine kinase